MKIYLEVLLVLVFIPTVLTCSCFPTHLQSQFCTSKVVIHAIPISENTSGPERTYQIFIVDILKGGSPHIVEWSVGTVSTPSTGAACGVRLQLFKNYILGGSVNNQQGALRVVSCGLHRIWSQFNTCQLGLLHTADGYDCSCVTRYCFESDPNSCNAEPNECTWNSSSNRDEIINCQRDNQNVCKWTTPC